MLFFTKKIILFKKIKMNNQIIKLYYYHLQPFK
jgi:hypothetical protein